MYPVYHIERLSEDKLTLQVWKFMLIEATLVLDSYIKSVRDSTRKKKFNYADVYDRIYGRRWAPNKINAVDIPIPQDVKDELWIKFTDSVKIKVEKSEIEWK